MTVSGPGVAGCRNVRRRGRPQGALDVGTLEGPCTLLAISSWRAPHAPALCRQFTTRQHSSASPTRPCASTLLGYVPSLSLMAVSDIPSKPLPPPARDEKLPSIPPLDFEDFAAPRPPPKIVQQLAEDSPPQIPHKPSPIDTKASLSASDLCTFSSPCISGPPLISVL